MTHQKLNLIIAILLLGIFAAAVGVPLAHGETITNRQLILDGSLLMLAASRFMMFKDPNSPLSGPLRILAILGLVAYVLMK
jgi:hypothetical protein